MIVGTAGHVDHGKTSLVRALTGVDTDRLKEEKTRGISIDLGFAYLPVPGDKVLGFVDVPGHEKFVHTMVAGATGMDFVILVVAADDGVMPQTLEHLAILELLGVNLGIVAVSKVDAVTQIQREHAIASVRDLLASSHLNYIEIVPVSCVTGEGLDILRQRLIDAAQSLPLRLTEGPFRFAVDRCFTLTGVGTVVTGLVLSGVVTAGDIVTISPSGADARVRSVHAQNRASVRGVCGERCALSLVGAGVSRDAIVRGDFILASELHAPANRIDVKLRLLASEKRAVTQWMPVRVHHAAAELGARIVLLTENPVAPGEEAFVQLVLDRPIAAVIGDRFVLRDTTAQRTIGGGVFVDLRAPARRRRSPERRAQLLAHANRDPSTAIVALLKTPPFFVDLTCFARDRALSAQQVHTIVRTLGLAVLKTEGGDVALLCTVLSRVVDDLLTSLAAFHAKNPDLTGVTLDRIRLSLEPCLPPSVFRSLLYAVAADGEIALDGSWVRLASHQVQLNLRDEEVWHRIEVALSGASRFKPPRVRDIARILELGESDIRRIMKLLCRRGQLNEVAHDHFFLRTTLAEVTRIIAELAAKSPNGQFSAAELRDRLDNGRKLAIQLLEFMDRQGVTLRRGDLRRIIRERLDTFGSHLSRTDLQMSV